MAIAPGHQFGAIAFRAFSLAEPIHAELDFGFGLSATPGPPAPLTDTWRNWLGTLQTEHIEEANLSLVATAVSPTPLAVDAQLQHLLNRAEYFLWGAAISAGVPNYTNAVSVGGGSDGQPTVRMTGEPRDLVVTHGAAPALVQIEDIAAAAGIVAQLEMIVSAAPLYERFARGINALVAAFRASAPDEQIHQSVRAIEALLPPEAWGAAAFIQHAEHLLVATPDRDEMLNDFYQLRNAVEHLRGLDNRALPNVPPPDRPAVAMRRVRQAERLAIALYRRVFTPGGGFLYLFRTEDSIRNFWRQPETTRRSVWGAAVDVSNVQ